MDEIRKLWETHEARLFPSGHRTKEIGGVSLTLLESEIGGLVLTYLNTEGTLGRRQLKNLHDSNRKLSVALNDLEGDAKDYFTALQKIVKILIDKLPEPDPNFK